MCQQINVEETLWISHYIRLSSHKMLSNRKTTKKSDYTKNKNLNDKTKLMLIIPDNHIYNSNNIEIIKSTIKFDLVFFILYKSL